MKGRKKLNPKEKRHPITVFVKAKNYAATEKAIKRIATAIENNKDGGSIRVDGGKDNPNE